MIYFSAQRLFDTLADRAFNRGNISEKEYQNIFTCDLLIIDDLGTEMANSFTMSQFFVCLNERLRQNRSIVISTNLDIGQITSHYSERVASRISDRFQILPLHGKDIRILKRLK